MNTATCRAGPPASSRSTGLRRLATKSSQPSTLGTTKQAAVGTASACAARHELDGDRVPPSSVRLPGARAMSIAPRCAAGRSAGRDRSVTAGHLAASDHPDRPLDSARIAGSAPRFHEEAELDEVFHHVGIGAPAAAGAANPDRKGSAMIRGRCVVQPPRAALRGGVRRKRRQPRKAQPWARPSCRDPPLKARARCRNRPASPFGASDSARRQARAPGRPENRPSMWRVTAQPAAFAADARRCRGAWRGRRQRIGIGAVSAEDAPVGAGQDGRWVVIGRAPDHHPVEALRQEIIAWSIQTVDAAVDADAQLGKGALHRQTSA
jgi:hypothetical protein